MSAPAINESGDDVDIVAARRPVQRRLGARPGVSVVGVAGDNVTTLLEVSPLGDAYDAADDRTRELAVDAVLTAIEPYRDGDGWRLPGTALKVIARRP